MTNSERKSLAKALRAGAARCWETLAGDAAVLRVPQLAETEVERLLEYLDTLLLWRARISLVATEEPIELVQRHLVDSLALLPFLAPGTCLADIGSGAGLPGLVCAIAAPDLQVRLVEPRRKRASFLREAAGRSAAGNAKVLEARAEDVGAAEARTWTTAVSRAFGTLEEFLRLLAELRAGAGGTLPRTIAMKGPQGRDEARTFAEHRGTPAIATYDLGDGVERLLLIYDAAAEGFT